MLHKRIALASVFALLAAVGALSILRVEPDDVDPTVELAAASLGLETSLLFAALAAAALSRRPLVERLGLGPARLPAFGMLLLVLGTLGVSFGLDGILELSGLREQSVLAEFEALLEGTRGWPLLFVLLAIGLAPGIAEELLCRGLIQRGLEPLCGAPLAVVLAAVVFGALHVDPLHAACAAVLGLYLGTAAVLAGSVRASMLCHVVNNALAVLGAAWLPLEIGGLGLLLGFPLAGACLWGVVRGGAGGPPTGPTGAPGAGNRAPTPDAGCGTPGTP